MNSRKHASKLLLLAALGSAACAPVDNGGDYVYGQAGVAHGTVAKREHTIAYSYSANNEPEDKSIQYAALGPVFAHVSARETITHKCKLTFDTNQGLVRQWLRAPEGYRGHNLDRYCWSMSPGTRVDIPYREAWRIDYHLFSKNDTIPIGKWNAPINRFGF